MPRPINLSRLHTLHHIFLPPTSPITLLLRVVLTSPPHISNTCWSAKQKGHVCHTNISTMMNFLPHDDEDENGLFCKPPTCDLCKIRPLRTASRASGHHYSTPHQKNESWWHLNFYFVLFFHNILYTEPLQDTKTKIKVHTKFKDYQMRRSGNVGMVAADTDVFALSPHNYFRSNTTTYL